MYSRAERKFLNPEKDQANPLLGPGCYTPSDTILITGPARQYGKNGYAPFSSLAPRVSFFEQGVSKGPPPGNYELSLSAVSKVSALFGRSKDVRFKNNNNTTPGPGAYLEVATEETELLRNAHHQKDMKSKRNIMARFGLNQAPVGIVDRASPIEERIIDEEISAVNITPMPVPVAAENGDPIINASAHTLQEKISPNSVNSSKNEMALVATNVDTANQSARIHTGSSNNTSKETPPSKRALIWKRKHIPPSIPVGQNIYGYKENPKTGDMEPRKPPNPSSLYSDPPSHLFSFVEQAKHQKKGHAFAKGSKRLVFKSLEGPGPNAYNPPTIYGIGKSSAVITMAPCKRITDEIITFSTKQGVPGPGAYQIKAPISAKLSEPRNRIRFGAGKGTCYLNPDLMKIPGPGAYFPENSLLEKPQSKKPKPFGSTTKRFQDTDYVVSQPSVGSYEVDEIDSIYQKVKKRSSAHLGQVRTVFGSVADRFQVQKVSKIPGPGAYDVQSSANPLNSAGKLVFFAGAEPMNVHAPVFGSQTNRFQDKIEDVPPPGAYNVSESFQKLNIHTTGRAGDGLLSSQSKREIFKVKERVPGPGEYEVSKGDAKDRRKNVGAFLSTETRFNDKYERLPGPGAYLDDNGTSSSLIKKTFNTTFGQTI